MTGAAFILCRPVAAVITHDSDVTVLAHSAVGVASELGSPLLFFVPIQRPPFTADPAIVARMYQRALREAESLAALARPILDAAGFSSSTRVVWHGSWSLRRSRPALTTALARAVRKSGATAVVTPLELPTRAIRGVRIVHLDAIRKHPANLFEATPNTSKGRTTPMSGIDNTRTAMENPVTRAKTPSTVPAQRPPWTFLTNHGHVLLAVTANSRALVEDIAATVGITARATLHILADLEDAGYLQRVREGRRTRYVVQPTQHFRHPATAHQEIGALLAIFTPTNVTPPKESS
ncbi:MULTISPECIES: helix-turn-helix transcriptional regulator [unclassified Arthrobacter]|uniref:helix-turn-helix transcriptional regulator n=1 Tax=unclassified Arthrobacter TaxID=235627 RepID=UPI0002DB3AA8